MKEADHKVKIAVDAMGGDFAPSEIVAGSVLAAKKDSVELILAGSAEVLAGELDKYTNGHRLPIQCVEASEFVTENEALTLTALRRANTSISVAAKLVKAGEAEAVVSAGPTGALVASAVQHLGMIDGIERPVIGGALATFAPNTVLMDCGVNVDCKPHHLVTFAVVGTIYAKKLLNIENPTVGLLNIGTEAGKGNDLTRQSYALLEKSGLNFIGNIEGNSILRGDANVVVCDGFTGNVMFKFCEGGFEAIDGWLKRKVKGFPLRGFLKNLSKDLNSLTSIPQSVGSGLIWGVNGIALKMHGASRAKAVADKIEQAKLVVEMDVVESLKSELTAIREKLNF